MGKGKILVLGVGNPFRRDDGVGPAVISRLQTENALQEIDIVDGGTDGLALIDTMQNYEHVLIVDAVEMGAQPGIIRMFTPEEAILTVQADTLSTHGFGLAEVLALMDKLEMKVNLRIIGIQAKDVTFGEGMSPEVAARLDDLLELVKNTTLTL